MSDTSKPQNLATPATVASPPPKAEEKKREKLVGPGWFRVGLRADTKGSRKLIVRLNGTPMQFNARQDDPKKADYREKVVYLREADVLNLQKMPDFHISKSNQPAPGPLAKNLTERGRPRPKPAPKGAEGSFTEEKKAEG